MKSNAPQIQEDNKIEITLAISAQERLKRYRLDLQAGVAAGGHLTKYCRAYLGKEPKELSETELLQALLNTKEPVILTGLHAKFDGSDWTSVEYEILCSAGIMYEVETYAVVDRHQGPSPKFTQYTEPFKQLALIVAMPLLTKNSPDYAVIVKDGKIDEDAYYLVLEERLLPLLMRADKKAGEKLDKLDKLDKLIIALPNLEHQILADDEFKGVLNVTLDRALKQILEKHKNKFYNIEAIIFDGAEGPKPETKEYFNLKYTVRKAPPLLSPPVKYGEIGNFNSHKKAIVVTAQGCAMPGGGANIDKCYDDESFFGRVTDSASVISGSKGKYNNSVSVNAYECDNKTFNKNWGRILQNKENLFPVITEKTLHVIGTGSTLDQQPKRKAIAKVVMPADGLLQELEITEDDLTMLFQGSSPEDITKVIGWFNIVLDAGKVLIENKQKQNANYGSSKLTQLFLACTGLKVWERPSGLRIRAAHYSLIFDRAEWDQWAMELADEKDYLDGWRRILGIPSLSASTKEGINDILNNGSEPKEGKKDFPYDKINAKNLALLLLKALRAFSDRKPAYESEGWSKTIRFGDVSKDISQDIFRDIETERCNLVLTYSTKLSQKELENLYKQNATANYSEFLKKIGVKSIKKQDGTSQDFFYELESHQKQQEFIYFLSKLCNECIVHEGESLVSVSLNAHKALRDKYVEYVAPDKTKDKFFSKILGDRQDYDISSFVGQIESLAIKMQQYLEVNAPLLSVEEQRCISDVLALLKKGDDNNPEYCLATQLKLWEGSDAVKNIGLLGGSYKLKDKDVKQLSFLHPLGAENAATADYILCPVVSNGKVTSISLMHKKASHGTSFSYYLVINGKSELIPPSSNTPNEESGRNSIQANLKRKAYDVTNTTNALGSLQCAVISAMDAMLPGRGAGIGLDILQNDIPKQNPDLDRHAAEERAQLDAAKLFQEAQARAQAETERKRQEAEKARREAEEQAKLEKAKKAEEEKARLEAEKAKQEAQARAEAEARKKAQLEAEKAKVAKEEADLKVENTKLRDENAELKAKAGEADKRLEEANRAAEEKVKLEVERVEEAKCEAERESNRLKKELEEVKRKAEEAKRETKAITEENKGLKAELEAKQKAMDKEAEDAKRRFTLESESKARENAALKEEVSKLQGENLAQKKLVEDKDREIEKAKSGTQAASKENTELKAELEAKSGEADKQIKEANRAAEERVNAAEEKVKLEAEEANTRFEAEKKVLMAETAGARQELEEVRRKAEEEKAELEKRESEHGVEVKQKEKQLREMQVQIEAEKKAAEEKLRKAGEAADKRLEETSRAAEEKVKLEVERVRNEVEGENNRLKQELETKEKAMAEVESKATENAELKKQVSKLKAENDSIMELQKWCANKKRELEKEQEKLQEGFLKLAKSSEDIKRGIDDKVKAAEEAMRNAMIKKACGGVFVGMSAYYLLNTETVLTVLPSLNQPVVRLAIAVGAGLLVACCIANKHVEARGRE